MSIINITINEHTVKHGMKLPVWPTLMFAYGENCVIPHRAFTHTHPDGVYPLATVHKQAACC